MQDFEDECVWYPYRIVARIDSTGEIREQARMGRDANHALERAAAETPSIMIPLPDSVKATRMWGD